MLRFGNRVAGPLAAVCIVAAVVGFGAVLEGFGQSMHPVSLLGAFGVPGARAFNLTGYLVPGVLAAWAAAQWIATLANGAPVLARIGAQMILLAALAYAAMGVFPLDASNIENRASQWHAVAWMVWVLAFGAGALLTGLAGLGAGAAWRPLSGFALACGVWMLLFALLLEAVVPAAIAQRLALAGWLVWLLLSPRVLPRAG